MNRAEYRRLWREENKRRQYEGETAIKWRDWYHKKLKPGEEDQ